MEVLVGITGSMGAYSLLLFELPFSSHENKTAIIAQARNIFLFSFFSKLLQTCVLLFRLPEFGK